MDHFKPSLLLPTFPLVALLSICLVGCASIVKGTNQEVAIQTSHQNSQIFGAKCTVKNDEKTKTVITPGKVLIEKSSGFLDIRCEKQGLPPGHLRADSHTGDEVYGNILIGGLIGAGIDIGSGAAYEYKNTIIVPMGKSLLYKAEINTDQNIN
ncbi:MAG: hypothetical protein RPU64_10140 [Candidatus Sedimenticola sp. (ex Thyasira tokunagai)]